MSVTVPLWAVLASASVVVCIAVARIFRAKGDYDFATPILGAGIILIIVALWVGACVGRAVR